MSDEFEIANFEHHVADLESELSDMHLLVIEARNIISRVSHLVDGDASWHRDAEAWLNRAPRR